MFGFLKRLFKKKSISDTIYVGNLGYSVTKHDLARVFAVYGTVTNARVIRDPRSKQSKGYGFVTFLEPLISKKALDMDGKSIRGRTVNVKFARERQRID